VQVPFTLAVVAPTFLDGRGLVLWRYLAGPWQEVAAVPFEAS